MNATILNAGAAAWIFEEHARHLSRALNLEISATPAEFNYVLGWDEAPPPNGHSFIPFEAIQIASDKRIMATIFEKNGVAIPRTVLLDSVAEVTQFLRRETHCQWVLKWPIGCAASGHRLLTSGVTIPDDWPRPYLLQEFVRSEVPEVFRLYGAGGETFGWNARRFPDGAKSSPFVAHARGAHYEIEAAVPPAAAEQARRALSCTKLLDSFGCADLMRDQNNRWLVLEVNTDGVFNYVDRDISIENITAEIDQRLNTAFHNWRAA